MASVSISASATSPTKEGPHIHFDPSYVKTIPGMIKIAEALCSLIGFICIQSIYLASYISAGGWYSFVSMTGFWISLLLLVFYIFHIIERLTWIPWLIGEGGFAALWSAFFFIAACVAASYGRQDPGWGAAAFFGFVGMIIFGYEAYVKYIKWKSGDAAQGEKAPSNVETSTSTGPSYPAY